MKKLFTLAAVIVATLVATKSNAQVYVNARVGFPVPAAAGIVCEDDFPGYAYYDYPAWNGHYQDYSYYAHYRPFFERRYAGYFHGGRFVGGGYAGRGIDRGGYANRGFDQGGFAGRGGYAGHGGYEGRGGYAGHGGSEGRGGPEGHGGHGGYAGHGGSGSHGGGGSHGGRR